MCREFRLDHYLRKLGPDGSDVCRSDTNAWLVFGDVGRKSALYRVDLLVQIGGRVQFLRTSVVYQAISLLIGWRSKARMRMRIDAGNNTVTVNFGADDFTIRCDVSSSGHLVLSLWDSSHRASLRLASLPAGHSYWMFAAESWGDERLARKELLALHTKLGHAAFPHLVEQLALAYPDRDASPLRTVARGLVCESCEKRRKAPRCPLVAMPKEPHFNYETGADLWYLRGQPVLHVICLFTRLRHCSVLCDKSATHVCHSLLHLWVKYYGPPVLFYTDLGKEFDNELIRMFGERYGITLHCASGGSHWSLGGVERQHYQLRHTVELLLEADDTLSLQDACDVACMSLNCHPMPDQGFSPHQLVYGVSSRWPDFVAAKLPALAETPVPSDHVGHYMVKFLDAMYRAREKFQAADVRAKVPLVKRSRPSNNRKVELVTGDTVFTLNHLRRARILGMVRLWSLGVSVT